MNTIADAKSFTKAVKKLSRKFRNIESDVKDFKSLLRITHELPQSKWLFTTKNKATAIKFRQNCSDIQDGKSGGYRIIGLILAPDEDDKKIVLLTVYIKKAQDTISKAEIDKLIKELASDLEFSE